MPSASPRPLPYRRIKTWAFRASAVLLGFSVFLVVELLCVLADWGRPTSFDDPFVGFHAQYPLFVRDPTGERFEIPPARRHFFCTESFPAVKGDNEFRIFVLGGSTVAGEPFSSQTSFTTWLELALRAADSGRDWNVINCGGISYASYRLTPILQECLSYQPDLFILCLSHNEFLEDRTYDDLKKAPAALTGAYRVLGKSRTFTLLRAGVNRWRTNAAERPAPGSILPAEVDARLDHQGGLEVYHRDPQWSAGIQQHFGLNLRRMVVMAQSARVPVILVHETSNLSDCPPFKSEHREDLSVDDEHAWQKVIDESRGMLQSDASAAADGFQRALQIDGEFALTWYELGKCYEALHDDDRAKAAFLKARDLDVCPLRITTPLEQELFDVAAEFKVPLVDAHQLLERRTAHGILGDFWLVDHVHPSFAGHQAIAVALLDEMIREGFVTASADSETRRTQSFQQHFASLPPIYFERGQRTLELLRGWTKGRADGPPIGPRSHDQTEP